MSVTPPHRPWPTDEPSQVNSVELTSTITPINRASSFGASQFPESISSTLPDRRSLPGVRKPLRSSPLAGPVLQADEAGAEVKETANPRPSRIVSTPDFASLITPLPPSKRARPRTAESAQTISPPSAPRPTNSDVVKGPTTSHLFLSGNSAKQANTDLGGSASSAQSSFNASPAPALCPPTSKAGYRGSPHFRATARRPNTAHGYPTTPSSLLGSNQSSAEPTSLARRDSGDNSWLIANPYETTPKFTRLGLASQGIVLPLSAKEHKRLAHQNSKSSVKTSTTRISRVGSADSSDASFSSQLQHDTLSLPSSSLTKCNGSNPASEPLSSLQPRESNAAPVTSSSSATIPECEASDLQYPSASKPDNYARSVPSPRTSRKGPLARFKDLTLRTFKSSASLTKSHSTPMIEKLTTAADSRPQREIKIGFFAPRSGSPTASESTADSKTAEVGVLPQPTSRSRRDSRKSWKSFAIWHRNRST